MFEKQIIDGYKTGKLSGILETENCFYLPVRITGTEENIRDGELEYRSKAELIRPEAMQKCKSLPITLGHPTKKGGEETLLNHSSLQGCPIIGQTVDSYLKQTPSGDEIWGVARIYDKSLIKKLGNTIHSTSPGFACYYIIQDNDLKIEAPAELNHLAFVERGHWDQKKGSAGFDISSYNMLQFERIGAEQGGIIMSDTSKGAERTEDLPVISANEGKTAPEVKDDNPALLAAAAKTTSRGDSAENADSEEVEDGASDKADSDENVEIVDSDENVEIVDSDENVEIVDSDENVEIVDSSPEPVEEVIGDEYETKDDKERESALEDMRDCVDSAAPFLAVKMPVLKRRETARSVVSKFMRMNRKFVSKKYENIRLDSMTDALAREILNDTISNIRARSEKFNSKPVRGFVPSKYGAVDRNF